MSLSEEEQEVIIAQKTKTGSPDKDIDRGSTDEDTNIPTERGRFTNIAKIFLPSQLIGKLPLHVLLA